jgi:ribosomal biogenesis protein LAS1
LKKNEFASSASNLIHSRTQSTDMSSRLAPWTSTREWRRVADALARTDDDSAGIPGDNNVERNAAASEESVALRTVDAWRARGRVPLAVDVTASLVDAMRRDDGSVASSSVSSSDGRGTRLEYAMTLVRLVNGAVDPTQKGRYAAPIATLASKIHLPQELVDLRHEATHDALPSLRALRRGARLALAWCRTWYWDKQRRAFEETTEAMRRCVWELCENEGRARVLAAREGSKYAPSSSEDEDGDEQDGGAGGRASDAAFDFKSVRERRRGLLGKLGSLCPKGASHALVEALSECWPTVVRGDDDDGGDGATLDYEEFSASAPVDSRDWQPTLGRLCQKWPGLFVHVLEDRLTHGDLRDDDVLGQIEGMIELGQSAELADSSQKEIVASAMRRALVSDCWRARDACDDARVKRILKSLQKATGASKEDLKPTQSGEPASGLSALEQAKAAQAALVESMASGRKRKRDSRWEHVEEWTPCPIGVVPGVDLSRLHCVTETALRVSSGVASFDGDAALAYRAPIVVVDDEDDCDDDNEDRDDDMDDGEHDDMDDDDDGENLETEAEAGALNVGGVRVKLSKEQRASVAASVACLL